MRTAKEDNAIENTNKNDIIVAGGVSGARDPDSEEANEHAERYYALVRKMSTDVEKIAKTTGRTKEEIQSIKNYIFINVHELGDGRVSRFDADFMMAQSWQRLVQGNPEPHDLTLINHEIMEKDLMSKGFTQEEAHLKTSEVYNYGKEAREFYDKIGKYKRKR